MKAVELLPNVSDNIKSKLESYDEHNDLFELLEEVVYKNDIAVFDAMLESGMDVNMQNKYGWTPLHIAIRRDRREMVEKLLEKGADINKVDGVGWTPLMEAIMDDMPELCEYLVNQGVDKTIANQRGATAAMLVQKFGRSSMMHLF